MQNLVTATKSDSYRSSKYRSIIAAASTNSPPFVLLDDKSSSKRTEPFVYYQEDEVNTPNNIDLSTQKWSRKYRLDFIKKVYSIFTVQMISTVAITSIIMNNPALSRLLLLNFEVVSLSTCAVSMLAAMALLLSPRCRYSSPTNFILLGLFTLAQSVVVGTFSSLFNPRTVCLGGMHTLSALLAITLYAFQPNPKYDLTASGNILLASLSALTMGTILNFFFRMPLLNNLISGLLAVVFAGYIAYDTQMIVGGKSKRQYATNDYILAALNLYQDVISFFIQILKILGRDKEND
eukprot:gene28518-37472_t